ncbi:MAG: ATP synthase subunit I [Proteobacteria bacterium]|nr:ATP synthase subunit I [Pseudomonadota bacterium]MBU1138150.1 ATP synthase subunit I [Pseudomonadota bacterium]
MMMTVEASWPYLLGFLGGAGLGFFYFGGLWLTVKKIPASSNPKRLLLWSAALRLVPTLLALFIVVRVNPGVFLIMLPGFFGVRSFLIRRVSNLRRGQAHAT